MPPIIYSRGLSGGVMLSNIGFIEKLETFECAVLLVVWFGLALAYLAIYMRRKRIERRIRAEVTNLGNVNSRFHLRVENPGEAIEVVFYHSRQRLPWIAVEGNAPAAPALAYAAAGEVPQYQHESAAQKAAQGAGVLSSASSLLSGLGNILPRQLGRPFQQLGSRIYRGQMKVGVARSKVNRTMSYAPNISSSGSTVPTASTADTSIVWAETQSVDPGESLTLSVLLKPAWSGQDQVCAFRLLSISPDAPTAQVVAQESQVTVKGGFLSHAFYPQLVVLALTAALLVGLFWMRSRGLFV
jgi:hypothetical protein